MAKDKRKELQEAVNAYMDEANKFWDNGNASAGTRARTALMTIKNLVSMERTAIQDQKNAKKGK